MLIRRETVFKGFIAKRNAKKGIVAEGEGEVVIDGVDVVEDAAVGDIVDVAIDEVASDDATAPVAEE